MGESRSRNRLSGLKLCVVDADEGARAHAVRALSSHGLAIDALGAVDPGAALPAYDAMILDIHRPGVDGPAVLSGLRSASGMALVVVSDHGDEERIVAAFEAGADDYLTRPFHPGDLAARVALRAHTASARAPRSLVLAPDGRSVLFAGRPLALTGREQAVLSHLMASPGRLFTREELRVAVWGDEWESSGIVTEYIRRIRVHLRRRGLEDCIVTRHGLGYLYDPSSQDE